MEIKMLTSWAGDQITARFGEIINLPDEVALAQVEAGNAELAVAPVAVPEQEATEEAKPAEPKKKK